MCPSFIDSSIAEDFQKWSTVYPQPVASSLSCLLGNRTPQYIVENSLKAAEVSARYIAACSLASFAARIDAKTDGESVPQLVGNLSFGTFEQIIAQISGKAIDHPLKTSLEIYTKLKPGLLTPGEQESTAIWLGHLVELRNDLGHSLSGISEAKARTILRNDKPLELLHGILKRFEHLLSHPLFIIDEQRIERGVITAQILWLMGGSKDPIPEEILLETDVHYLRHPYLAVDKRILDLCPQLVWDSVPNRAYYGLLFIDGVRDTEINYQSLESEVQELNGDSVARLNTITSGESHPCEEVNLTDNRHLVHVWRSEQRLRIEALSVLQGKMPWEKFSAENLKWYASRLAPGSDKSPRAIIQQELFDQKVTFDKDQIFQAILLFGKETEIRPLINRDLMDIRIQGESAGRWKERYPLSKNIIQSLRISIQTVAKALEIQNASIETLESTEGTPDYIAIREALINQFIHQDYHDPRGAAQIEILKEKVTFFNMGYALVSPDSLIQGGKSQSRNPLIARALRLIGFAELAGSGLRELQRVWRTANQRPPSFISNKDENNFTLLLDWRPLKNFYDEFWKTKIGVHLTPQQVLILNLTADPAGITLEQGVSGSGLSFESTKEIFRYLLTQALIEQQNERYYVREHLKILLKEVD